MTIRFGSTLVFAIVVVAAACGGGDDAPLAPGPDAGDAAADAPVVDGGPPVDPCKSDVTPAPGIVLTDRGAVRGAHEGGAWAYRNIPFTAPPTGALRWRAPAPAACWKGIREGTAWGPACPQSDEKGTAPITGSEDCLQLNVFAPADKPGPLPIMFWIHGGGNALGSATQETSGVRIFDGGSLAAKEGVIVVSTNYRLGVLGFLAHPSLAAENADRAEGNYAILDLIAALRWVKTNAAAIGGDPARVIIFGESAGAVNVCTLVASPLAKGLFAGAIMESGACVASQRVDGEALGAKVFAGAKCDVAPDPLACMRALGTDAVIKAFPVVVDVAGAAAGFTAVNDGHALTGKPLDVIKAGGHAKVPMIVGSNSDETSRTVPLLESATDLQYQAAVRALFPAFGDAVLAQYPSADYASPRAAYVALTTDAKFGCQTRRTLRALTSSSTVAYRYYFSHALENAQPAVKKFGAWHGLDTLFVFDHLAIAGYVASAGDTAVASAFMHRWASFAKSAADVNGGQEPAWPTYENATDPYLELASPVVTGAGVRTAQCDFWDALVP